MKIASLLLGFLLLLASAYAAAPATVADLIRDGLTAESALDSQKALALFQAADLAQPNNAFILQKIARQYSDSVFDVKDVAEKKRRAQLALGYAERAVALEPNRAVNVLSLAVCHGALGLYSDNATKVRYAILVKQEAERALVLEPDYAWAHHVLGRWHHEVVSLGATKRFFVNLFYDNLPPASLQESIAHLERAVALDPGTLSHHLELGFAYLADGQKEKARLAFEHGLAMPSSEKSDGAAKWRARNALEKLN